MLGNDKGNRDAFYVSLLWKIVYCICIWWERESPFSASMIPDGFENCRIQISIRFDILGIRFDFNKALDLILITMYRCFLS